VDFIAVEGSHQNIACGMMPLIGEVVLLQGAIQELQWKL